MIQKTTNRLSVLKRDTFNAIANDLNLKKQPQARARSNPLGRKPCYVDILNCTGPTLLGGHPVKLIETEIGIGEEEKCYAVMQDVFKPAPTDSRTINYAIPQSDIPVNAMGSAIINGICNGIVNIDNVEHQYAKLTDTPGAMVTTAGKTTIRILRREAGTGPGKICKLHLGVPVYTTLGEAITTIDPDTLTAVRVMRNEGAGIVDTGLEEEVLLDWISDEPISAGKEIGFQFFPDEGIFRVLWAECETPDPISAGATSNGQLIAQIVPAAFANYGAFTTFGSIGFAGGDADGVGLDNSTGRQGLWTLDLFLIWVATANNQTLNLRFVDRSSGTPIGDVLTTEGRQTGNTVTIASTVPFLINAGDAAAGVDLQWSGNITIDVAYARMNLYLVQQ